MELYAGVQGFASSKQEGLQGSRYFTSPIFALRQRQVALEDQIRSSPSSPQGLVNFLEQSISLELSLEKGRKFFALSLSFSTGRGSNFYSSRPLGLVFFF